MNGVTFNRQRLTSNKPVNAVAEGERKESHPQVLERHSVAKKGDVKRDISKPESHGIQYTMTFLTDAICKILRGSRNLSYSLVPL